MPPFDMHATIDSLYECALVGDKWGPLFDTLGHGLGSFGGMIFATTAEGTFFTGNECVRNHMADFVEGGWVPYNTRVERLLRSGYQGFVTDLDIYSDDEIAGNPMYSQFLQPRGLNAAAATAITGIEKDALIFTLEGFSSDAAARYAMPVLDKLRPHIARAVMVSSRLKLERARAMTQAMDAVGIPAAVIDRNGTLRAANRRFEPMLGFNVFDGRDGIWLSDRSANTLFQSALNSLRKSSAAAISIPLRPNVGEPARVLHMVPIAGDARDLFPSGSVLLAVAGGAHSNIETGLLTALFDLTPAEARVANGLAKGQSATALAKEFGTSVHTVRTQIKSILGKTGTESQQALVAIICSLAMSV